MLLAVDAGNTDTVIGLFEAPAAVIDREPFCVPTASPAGLAVTVTLPGVVPEFGDTESPLPETDA